MALLVASAVCLKQNNSNRSYQDVGFLCVTHIVTMETIVKGECMMKRAITRIICRCVKDIISVLITW